MVINGCSVFFSINGDCLLGSISYFSDPGGTRTLTAAAPLPSAVHIAPFKHPSSDNTLAMKWKGRFKLFVSILQETVGIWTPSLNSSQKDANFQIFYEKLDWLNNENPGVVISPPESTGNIQLAS